MPTESFLVTALPRTADPARSVHVSLFVTHRLTPDGADGVVGDFEHVATWADRLAGAEIELRGRIGIAPPFTIPITPRLGAIEPPLWPRVFPADLVVRPWQTPDPAAAPWKTFAAHRMQQHALLTHAASLFSSPVAAPGVAGNVLTEPLLIATGLGQVLDGGTLDDVLDRDVDGDQVFHRLPIDDLATTFLDRIVDAGDVTPPGTARNPLLQLTTDVHRVRRYYLREQEQTEYQDVPDEDPVITPISKPTPDFHERAGLLGDLSPLLRRLGLIIDLRVDDVAALAGVTEISATIEVPGLANAVAAQPRTACIVSGSSFFVASASGDHHRGLLRLGDEERFRVLDLDPDASGLKLEQYVRTVPRLLVTERNGDHVTSSPAGLRATGLSIARVDRADQLQEQLTDAPARDADLLAGTAPPLTAEGITRGYRLEVWDDVSAEWHSLHRRRLGVEVEGAGAVITDAADVGFLQGAALSRVSDGDGPVAGSEYHAHEVIAGWDGWSLSVPRPGRVVVHDGGEERLVEQPDVDPDPVNPVASTSRIEPLTLPWLRYGRNYSFRAWTVDLAGNSTPHVVAGPVPDDGLDDGSPAAAAPPGRRRRAGRDAGRVERLAGRTAEARLGALPLDATVDPDDRFGAGEEIRTAIRAQRPVVEPGPRSDRLAAGLDLAGIAPTGFEEVDSLVRERLVRRAESAALRGPTRRERIERSFDVAAHSLQRLSERIDARLPADVLGSALASAADTILELPGPSGTLIGELADLITTPRPFLRWDPIVEPVVVPRHRYTEAESQLTLVIRSGVDAPTDDDPLAVDVIDPATYSGQMLTEHPSLDLGWRADSQRHLAPPKSSQLDAELHGLFDDAIGGASEAAVRHALGVALREAGTLLDDTIADIANPGARLPQPGVELHTGPTADIPAVTVPGDLERGAGLEPGQYVIHNVDDLVLPYLPDPMATKVSMTFPDAGVGHHLFGFFAIEGVTLPYGGTWPELEPLRLVLESGEELGARTQGRVVTIRVPPGEQLRMNLSSGLERDQLDLHGLWRSLPDAVRDSDVIAEAAADGWFWWLTPATPVRLVHAVPRPVEVPRPTVLLPVRTVGDTAVVLFGGVDLHGPSTERLDVEAEWSEWIDDLAKPAPERIDVQAAAASTTVRYDEDLIVLAGVDATVPLPGGDTLDVHAAVHQLGDTRHRTIDYRMRATTRYREYFDPRVVPTIDDLSVVGPVRTLDVPSTARPAKPVVRDVLPMFRWFEETEPAQPFGLRRTRRAGLRVYLERPWFSSGEGELIGLVVAFGSDAAVDGNVTVWGGDPVFAQEGPANRAILPLTDLAHLVGLDDRREGARPVGPPVARTLVDVKGDPAVWILGYEPEFSEDRGLWFADIALDPGSAIWPFVRLALTRYQPSSLAGQHLSPVVLSDFVPLPPERIATLTRPDRRHARVIVTGPVGAPRTSGTSIAGPTFAQSVLASRTVRARLEHRLADVPSDLGWETVRTVDLPILGFEGTTVSWSGEIELPQAIPPRRPGVSQAWRVTVEEWEHLPADPSPRTGQPTTQSRIVYADHLPL